MFKLSDSSAALAHLTSNGISRRSSNITMRHLAKYTPYQSDGTQKSVPLIYGVHTWPDRGFHVGTKRLLDCAISPRPQSAWRGPHHADLVGKMTLIEETHECNDFSGVDNTQN